MGNFSGGRSAVPGLHAYVASMRILNESDGHTDELWTFG